MHGRRVERVRQRVTHAHRAAEPAAVVLRLIERAVRKRVRGRGVGKDRRRANRAALQCQFVGERLERRAGLAQRLNAVVSSEHGVGEVVGRTDVSKNVAAAIVDDQRRRIGDVKIVQRANNVFGLRRNEALQACGRASFVRVRRSPPRCGRDRRARAAHRRFRVRGDCTESVSAKALPACAVEISPKLAIRSRMKCCRRRRALQSASGARRSGSLGMAASSAACARSRSAAGSPK